MTSILRAAGPELRRRAAAPGVAGLIGRWARPLVAAAAAVIVAASAAILQSAGDGSGADDRVAATAAGPRQTETTAGLETALYPAPVGSWMEGNERPTVEEIVFSASVGQ